MQKKTQGGLICRTVAIVLGFAGGALAADIPLVENFEHRPVGHLAQKSGWQTHRDNLVRVQTSKVYAGNRALVLATNSVLRIDFEDPTATNVWIDFSIRVETRAVSGEPALSDGAVAGFYFDTVGNLVVRSNQTWVVCPGFTLPSGQWRRFTVNLDYGSRNWSIYVAGVTPNEISRPLATNLAFNACSTNTYFRSFRAKN
ncbi:MAG: hypothetical protein N2255_08605 [Kiritimatiellae bacterium]|nr:hypothetical protein [Kiritimatiellia bacterium]